MARPQVAYEGNSRVLYWIHANKLNNTQEQARSSRLRMGTNNPSPSYEILPKVSDLFGLVTSFNKHGIESKNSVKVE
jgi:hypothetical protein